MTVVNLQVKSSYTLLESPIKVKDLVQQAAEMNYSAIALTDHNVLYGAVEFYQAAKKYGIQPIIGLTLDAEGFTNASVTYPLILLAKDFRGYQALIKLSSYQRKAQEAVSLERIKELSSSLIVIVPTLQSELHQLYLGHKEEAIRELVADIAAQFPDSFLGISPEQEHTFVQLLEAAGGELVALGDVQYLKAEDAFATEVLKAIDRGQPVDRQADLTGEYALKTPEEFSAVFHKMGLQEAVDRTALIADRIDIELPLGQQLLPKYQTPEQMDADSYLRQLAEEGLRCRIVDVTEDYRERLDKELSVISTMGFSDYFLIVWDIMMYARREQIETGFGRGSAAASLVAYALEITNIDPIEYDLLFERFLNEQRYTMPDIDLDFPDNKRDKILQYVRDTYGDEHAAQISTFSTLAAKSSVRDTLRVFGADSEEMKQWSQAIPISQQRHISLEIAYEESASLRELVARSNRNKQIFQIAKTIEGLPRNVSTHAAGVVISDIPLEENVPLQLGSGELLTTQYTMEDTEAIGLLKMDFLALKNLTILANCFHYSAYEGSSSALTKADIPLNDPETLKLFARGDTNGIFQFESEGIKQVLKRMRPSSFEDIVATNALYRPGPMKQIQHFIDRKQGKEAIQYPHEDLKSILEVTYGVMVYQEQVMQVATTLAGYSLSEADQLRRTMSKKIQSEMDQGRDSFIQGALQQGYSQTIANQVYDYIEHFANYGFNRAHAVAYSMVAYQLAYMKVHYPKSFFAAILKSEFGHDKKQALYNLEMKDRGITAMGPDINRSFGLFSVVNEGILFGLSTVKGITSEFSKHIIEKRQVVGQFKDLIHFIEQLDERWLKVEYIRPLIEVGAFDNLPHNRQTLLNSLADIIQSVKISGQNMELFHVMKPRMQQASDFSLKEKLDMEMDLTGFYFSGHPTKQYQPLREVLPLSYIAKAEEGSPKYILASVTDIHIIQTKKGLPMSFVTLADETGVMKMILFPDQHRQFIKTFKQDDILIIKGKVTPDIKQKEDLNIIASDIKQAAPLLEQASHKLFLRFNSLQEQAQAFKHIQSLLKKDLGMCPVIIFDASTGRKNRLKKEYYYNLDEKTLTAMEDILGNGNVVLQ